MEKILVSACLLGARVRYHGGDAACDHLILRGWAAEGRLIAVCPEQEGGLPTPRPPAEIVPTSPDRTPARPGRGPSHTTPDVGAGGRAVIARTAHVRTAAGDDITADFCRGAHRALDVARQHNIRIAVLKDESPSCGSTGVFDGSFSGTRVAGVGVTTALLEAHGVRVFNETQLESAREWLERVER